MTKNYIKFSKPLLGQREKNEINKVIDSGWLTTGKKTLLFEKKFSSYKQVSCKHLSLLLINLKKNDEVITSAYLFLNNKFNYNDRSKTCPS